MDLFSIVKSNSVELIQNEFKNASLESFSLESIYEQVNQDGFVIISDDDTLRCVIVIDGMGGHQGGEKATEEVVKTCKKYLDNFKYKDLRLTLLDVLEESDQRIKNLKIGAGATVTAIEIGQNFVRFYNAGDAFGLLIGARGKLKFKTVEHSPLGFGIEAGIVDRSNDFIESHTVSNGLGLDPMRVEISQKMEIKSNDLVLISSDGILNNFTITELIQEMIEGDYSQRMKNLIDKVTKDSDHYLKDDTTIAFFKFK